MLTNRLERLLRTARDLNIALYRASAFRLLTEDHWADIQEKRMDLQDAITEYRREAAGIILNKAKGGAKL